MIEMQISKNEIGNCVVQTLLVLLSFQWASTLWFF